MPPASDHKPYGPMHRHLIDKLGEVYKVDFRGNLDYPRIVGNACGDSQAAQSYGQKMYFAIPSPRANIERLCATCFGDSVEVSQPQAEEGCAEQDTSGG